MKLEKESGWGCTNRIRGRAGGVRMARPVAVFVVLYSGLSNALHQRPAPSTRRNALTRGMGFAAATVMLPRGSLLAPGPAIADEPTLTESGVEAGAAEPEFTASLATEPPEPPVPPPKRVISAYDFDVPFRGEPKDIKPFLGKASVVVNVKFDDPETLNQMPALADLLSRYSSSGLHVLAFPTDQGWFEADDSNSLRLKYKSVYDFGQYPSAVVFDKSDLLGGNALPLYRWLTSTFANPWGVNRIVFNYEKFLVDEQGQPLRRYPRKFPVRLMEPDVREPRGCICTCTREHLHMWMTESLYETITYRGACE